MTAQRRTHVAQRCLSVGMVQLQRRKTTILSAVSILIATAADGNLLLVRRHRHHYLGLLSYSNSYPPADFLVI